MHPNRKSIPYCLCECGQVAKYKLKVPLLYPDLRTEWHAIMYLCEACFMLEQEMHSFSRRQPPKATRPG